MNIKKLLTSLVLSASIPTGFILPNNFFAPNACAMESSSEDSSNDVILESQDNSKNVATVKENNLKSSEVKKRKTKISDETDDETEDETDSDNSKSQKPIRKPENKTETGRNKVPVNKSANLNKPTSAFRIIPVCRPNNHSNMFTIPNPIRPNNRSNMFTNPNPIGPIHSHMYNQTASVPANQSRRITENSESLMNFQIFVHCDFYAVIHNLKILEKIPAMKSFLGSIDNCNGNIIELALKNMNTIRTIDQNLFDTIILKIRISDVLSPSSKIFLRHLVLAMRATR